MKKQQYFSREKWCMGEINLLVHHVKSEAKRGTGQGWQKALEIGTHCPYLHIAICILQTAICNFHPVHLHLWGFWKPDLRRGTSPHQQQTWAKCFVISFDAGVDNVIQHISLTTTSLDVNL